VAVISRQHRVIFPGPAARGEPRRRAGNYEAAGRIREGNMREHTEYVTHSADQRCFLWLSGHAHMQVTIDGTAESRHSFGQYPGLGHVTRWVLRRIIRYFGHSCRRSQGSLSDCRCRQGRPATPLQRWPGGLFRCDRIILLDLFNNDNRE
jgi:hypothetical protein